MSNKPKRIEIEVEDLRTILDICSEGITRIEAKAIKRLGDIASVVRRVLEEQLNEHD